MRPPSSGIGAACALLFSITAAPLTSQAPSPSPSPSPPLTRAEARLRDWIAAHTEEQIGVLERLVNQPSGTLNMAGVRAAGALFAAELDGLGFTTKWIEMPAEIRRGGHLVAERPARKRGKSGSRLLLIGHLDTVFEGDGQRFVRADSIARGAGSADMKGGDVILLYALKALAATGQLDAMDVTVVLTGDEEAAGHPLEISRRDLIAAAKRSDVALSFEGGSREFASITRRGASGWTLKVTARQAHSAGMFGGAGYGAIYEAARILTAFRDSIPREPGLTYNPGIIAGGAELTADTSGYAYQVAGKTNIIAPTAVVRGDLRFSTEEQKERTRSRMRAIVAKGLPGTTAEIVFEDSYPAMPLTALGEAVLAQYDTVSRALGYPAVRALDAARRGAGDLSFVAPFIPGIDGLGAMGGGAHSPEEFVHLPSLEMQTARAALLMARLAGLRN
ncbi:MAG TPA: M20/M25/M40 family metallo-hydrolase [Gemmatimonadales bacterium]|jgi:glutamate carboxypeptidase|nr:M20/M25/M40 family metallo-hydrolase [Gemmatimonadales bacterium]